MEGGHGRLTRPRPKRLTRSEGAWVRRPKSHAKLGSAGSRGGARRAGLHAAPEEAGAEVEEELRAERQKERAHGHHTMDRHVMR